MFYEQFTQVRLLEYGYFTLVKYLYFLINFHQKNAELYSDRRLTFVCFVQEYIILTLAGVGRFQYILKCALN